VTAGPGYRGDARGQRGARPRAWVGVRGGSGVAGGRAGRLLRAPHGGHPEFSGANQGQVREEARSGPATATRGRIVRRAPCGGPGSLSPARSALSFTWASQAHSACERVLPLRPGGGAKDSPRSRGQAGPAVRAIRARLHVGRSRAQRGTCIL
jgi:hypothetical protein